MRFSDEEYLRDWKDNGIFPKIHNNIFNLVASTCESETVLDLCACTGLIGQRLQDKLGLKVVAIEGDPAWVERGAKWGTNIPTLNIWVLPDTLPKVLDWITKNQVTGIVARRCISELFGNDSKGKHLATPNWLWAAEFTEAIVDAGVRELWLEGRADQGRSTHCIPDTETEIKCFSSHFKPYEWYGKCAYLTTGAT